MNMNRLKLFLLATVFPYMLMSCSGSSEEHFVKPTPDPTKPEPAPVEKVEYHKRAKELFDLINQYYQVKNGETAGLYNENYPKGSGDLSASFLWPFDGLVSGVGTLHALGYDVDYKNLVDRFELYWYEKNGIGGYGSQTNGKKGGATRFYDDNSIVGIDLVEAYRLTGDKTFLDCARRIITFLKSGVDDINGTALWWNEDQKNQAGVGDSNKPACANGYATNFLLNYCTVCPSEEKGEVLSFAKTLYTWLYTNLRDPEDNTYWNDMQVNGSINKTKWTYNTGVMISNGVLLFRLTGDETYLNQAKATAESSYSYFVRPSGSMALAYPDHDPWFTTKLVKAYVEIAPYMPTAEGYINTFVNFADHAYNKARTRTGFYYEDWTGAQPKRVESLLMQAAALESLGIIALYKNEKK